MNSIIITGYLLLGTWQDIKKRKISRNYLLFGGILGAVIRIISYRKENLVFAEWLVAFFPGIIILVIAKLTKEKIELSTNERNQLKIKYTDSEGVVQCYNALEYPSFNKVDSNEYFAISENDLKNLIQKTIFAVAVDDFVLE